MRIVAASSLLILAACLSAQKSVRDYPARAPFDGLRFVDAGPEVQVGQDTAWYRWEAIDGVPTKDVIAFAKKRCGAQWAKRIREDLVFVLSEMGHPPGPTVSLRVSAPDPRKRGKRLMREFPNVAMTRARRQKLKGAARRLGTPVQRAKPRQRVPDAKRFAHLVERRWDSQRPRLSAKDAAADLDQLEWHIAETFSYASLRGVDYRAALDTIRSGLGAGISRSDFHLQLRRLVASFGDGHARVRGIHRLLAERYPACVLTPHAGRVVAMTADRALLVADYPYVRSIGGKGIGDVRALLATVEAQGSRQFRSHLSGRNLPLLEFAVGRRDTYRVVLESVDGERTIERRVETRRRPVGYPGLQRHPSPQVLAGNVGYLRIPSMRGDGREERQAMRALRDTEGLILDVRNNGGGSRQILLALFPHFMKAGDAPHVANVGRYRLRPEDRAGLPEGYLGNRFMFLATSREWSDADRAAIAKFQRTFVPKWRPQQGRFSALHFMLLRPDPAVPHYDKPVVLLTDAGCFSATDIFVGAFHGWRNVTVMGTATGGGSGRSRGFRLAKSGLEVVLSTMVSYRPNGELYDGVGIAPDVEVSPTLTDVLGETDSVLERARRRLAK